MNTQFPLNTVIWIVLNMFIFGVIVVFILNQSFSKIAIGAKAKHTSLATVIIWLITWFVARTVLGHSRIIAPQKLVPLAFLVVYSSVAIAMRFSPIFRQAALSIPQDKLIGLHIVRVGGFVFLALLDMRLLPAEFALPAGYGDIAVALTAPVVVYALNRSRPFGRQLAIAWNFLGLLDFAIALVTGMTFIRPYVRQLAMSGHSIAYLDYVLMIPGFAVPILALIHVNSLYGLFTERRANSCSAGI